MPSAVLRYETEGGRSIPVGREADWVRKSEEYAVKPVTNITYNEGGKTND